MSAEQQVERLANYILENFQDSIKEGGAGDVAIKIMESYREGQNHLAEDVEVMNNILKVQGNEGNYNYDEYQLGYYNGIELISSLVQNRDTNFKELANYEFICYQKENMDDRIDNFLLNIGNDGRKLLIEKVTDHETC